MSASENGSREVVGFFAPPEPGAVVLASCVLCRVFVTVGPEATDGDIATAFGWHLTTRHQLRDERVTVTERADGVRLLWAVYEMRS